MLGPTVRARVRARPLGLSACWLGVARRLRRSFRPLGDLRQLRRVQIGKRVCHGLGHRRVGGLLDGGKRVVPRLARCSQGCSSRRVLCGARRWRCMRWRCGWPGGIAHGAQGVGQGCVGGFAHISPRSAIETTSLRVTTR